MELRITLCELKVVSRLSEVIFALADLEFTQAFRPGVAEQSVWIVDMHAIGLLDVPAMTPILGKGVAQMTDIWPSRGVSFRWPARATII